MLKYILIPLCGLLWAWAGADGTSKNWRRMGVPLAISLILWNPWGLLLYIPLILGYGIPCHNDGGSLVGRFFYKLAKKDEYLASLYTRTFIGIVYGLFISLVVWNLFPVVILGITVPLFGAVIKSIPQVKILGKTLNTEEMIIGAFVGCASCL